MLNDTKPELDKIFELRLVSAQSNDGNAESTATSGASVSPVLSTANITIKENDSPYGLLQFARETSKNRSILPLSDVFKMQVRESVGKIKLYIERAQGILGECVYVLWSRFTANSYQLSLINYELIQYLMFNVQLTLMQLLFLLERGISKSY